jgi:hypothetical protein
MSFTAFDGKNRRRLGLELQSTCILSIGSANARIPRQSTMLENFTKWFWGF